MTMDLVLCRYDRVPGDRPQDEPPSAVGDKGAGRFHRALTAIGGRRDNYDWRPIVQEWIHTHEPAASGLLVLSQGEQYCHMVRITQLSLGFATRQAFTPCPL